MSLNNKYQTKIGQIQVCSEEEVMHEDQINKVLKKKKKIKVGYPSSPNQTDFNIDNKIMKFKEDWLVIVNHVLIISICKLIKQEA